MKRNTPNEAEHQERLSALASRARKRLSEAFDRIARLEAALREIRDNTVRGTLLHDIASQTLADKGEG